MISESCSAPRGSTSSWDWCLSVFWEWWGLTTIRHAVEFLSAMAKAFTEVFCPWQPLKLLIAYQRGMIYESNHFSPLAEYDRKPLCKVKSRTSYSFEALRSVLRRQSRLSTWPKRTLLTSAKQCGHLVAESLLQWPSRILWYPNENHFLVLKHLPPCLGFLSLFSCCVTTAKGSRT